MRWERVRSAVLGLPQRFRAKFRANKGYQAFDVTVEYLDGEYDDCSESDDEMQAFMQDQSPFLARHLATISCVVLGICWTAVIFYIYPFPNTVPIFIGGVISLATWTIINLWQARPAIWRRDTLIEPPPAWPMGRRLCLATSTLMLLYWATLGIVPSLEELPVLHRTVHDIAERYFIAANLHNNEGVFSAWSNELLLLSAHRECWMSYRGTLTHP